MPWNLRFRIILCGLLWFLSGFSMGLVSAQTPPPCPPGGEVGDYGTGCSSGSAILYGGFGTSSPWLSVAERQALFQAGDAIRDEVKTFIQNQNPQYPFPRLKHNEDYFNGAAWNRWYDATNGERKALETARLYYWSIYTASQDPSDAERTRALQGMRDITALIATGHLLFGQQFLLRANNLRYTEELGSDQIIQKEQCLLSGRRFQATCDYNDLKANADYQFEEVLTDFTRIFGLSLRDGTTLGLKLGTKETDLFRLAIERSSQVNDAVARNLFALGDELRPRDVYRSTIGARYVQTLAIIDTLIQGPREQGLTLATELTTLRQSTQNLIDQLNPLGFDLSFSPLLAYSDAYSLARDALDGQAGALQLERDARQAAGDYNASLQRQRQELAAIRNQYHAELASLCGITLEQAQGLTDNQIGPLCDNSNAVVRVKYDLMLSALANVSAVQERMRQIPERLRITLDRDAKVIHATWTAGQQFAALDFAAELLRGFNVSITTSVGFPSGVSTSTTVSFNPYAPALAAIASARDMVEAAKEVQITQANSEAAVRNALLDQAYEARNLETAVQAANAAIVEYNNTLHRARTLIALRDQAVRDIAEDHETIDVLRIQNNRQALDAIAKFNDALKRTYMVAKVVEYDTIRPLPSALNPNGLFKLRRAIELNNYLSALHQYRTSYDFSSYLNQFTYPNISVTRELLRFNRDALQCNPDTGTDCIGVFFDDGKNPVACNGDRELDCQRRIFQEFVRRNTTVTSDEMGREIRTLVIDFSTPLDASYPGSPDAIFLPGVGGDKLAGVGEPLTTSKGVWLTFRTDQGVQLRTVSMRLTQSGHSLYKNANGCIIELYPRSPLAFLPYPVPIRVDETSAVVQACLATDPSCLNPTRAFLRRSVYSSNWRLEVSAGPGSENPNLILDQLQDIILNFDTTGFTITGTCP